MSRFGVFRLHTALVAASVFLAGCGTERRSILSPDAAGSAASTLGAAEDASRLAEDTRMHPSGRLARVMFVHASPDAPGVDVLVDRFKVARDLEYPGNTSYRRLRAGERRVRVNVAGTSTTVIDATVNLAPKQRYSAFAVNRVASIEPLVLEDDLTPPTRANAHVRFVHLSPDAPAVDVAVQGGPVVFANKAFKEYTPFTPVPAGTYDLEVRVANTSTVALSLPGIRLREGTVYTVFAKGLLSGSGQQALGAQIIVNRGRSDGSRRDDDDEDDDDDLRAGPPLAQGSEVR